MLVEDQGRRLKIRGKIRTLLLVLLSALLSYGIIGLWLGDWNVTQWNTGRSEAWKLIGGAVFLLFFFLFRGWLNKPK